MYICWRFLIDKTAGIINKRLKYNIEIDLEYSNMSVFALKQSIIILVLSTQWDLIWLFTLPKFKLSTIALTEITSLLVVKLFRL